MENLRAALNKNLESSRSNDFQDNYDFRRFGKKKTSKKGLISILRLLILGSKSGGGNKRKNTIWKNIDKLDWLYNQLDLESKKLLVQLLSYRLLGERYVKLPSNTPEYWGKLEKLDMLAECGEQIDLGYHGWRLGKINLQYEGFPFEIFVRPYNAYAQIILQQYRCETKSTVIEVEEDDVVIDAGGCFGDTAIYFACKAGESGRIFSFEFMPDNLSIFKRNLELNPKYSQAIDLVERPLWSESDKMLYVSGQGPGAKVSMTKSLASDRNMVVKTYTIDDLAKDYDLDVIDFIKMDVEGAELDALKGAEQSIRRWKPKLAISIYHYIEDFWQIPHWIESLQLDYEFHIRHFTIHAEETVLFAEVCSRDTHRK